MHATPVSIFSDHRCQLGEGPSFDHTAGALYWFDIVAGHLLEKRPGSGPTRVHDLGEMASAMAEIDGDRQLIFTETGLHVRDRASGRLSLLKAVEAENRVTRSNDARVHPCGALWFGTMGKKLEKGAGTIYWFFKGELRTLYSQITIPNAIAFSPDGTVAYYADTEAGVLMRVACDPQTGLPQDEPTLFLKNEGKGGFDGSVVDLDGLIWNARWGDSRLVAYGPTDGKIVHSVPLPVSQPSCPAFFGAAADRIAVTSALEGFDEAKQKAEPMAGMTLLVDLPVRGRPEPKVKI